MRYALIALTAVAGFAVAAPAFALNPQPLPPGARLSRNSTSGPPDPCRGMSGNGHIRCLQRHQHLPQKPPLAGSSNTSGAGAGK